MFLPWQHLPSGKTDLSDALMFSFLSPLIFSIEKVSKYTGGITRKCLLLQLILTKKCIVKSRKATSS